MYGYQLKQSTKKDQIDINIEIENVNCQNILGKSAICL